MKGLFTSEYVSLGHPDKVADHIAASIVQYCLEADPESHCGLEVLCGPDKVVVAGEVKSRAKLTHDVVEHLVRETVKAIGYTRPEDGFASTSLEVECLLHEQSPDIAQGVEGVGDKCINDGKIGCFPAGTMILTKTGYKDIIQVSPGDEVLTDDNTWHKVNALIPNGEKIVYELETSKGRVVQVTGNHQFRSNNYEWKSVDDMVEGDLVHSIRNYDLDGKLDPDYYLLGWCLGDGYFGKYPRVREMYLMANSKERDHLSNIISRSSFKEDFRESFVESDDCYYFYLYGSKVDEFISDRLYYNEDRAKDFDLTKIPADKIYSVLSGYFDSDGCVSSQKRDGRLPRNTISASSKSLTSLQHIQLLLDAFGIKSRISTRTRHDKRGFDFTTSDLTVYSNSSKRRALDSSLFQLLRKKTFLEEYPPVDNSNEYGCLREFVSPEQIVSIKEIGLMEVYDLSVEGNHSYTANGLIVHNSGDQGIMAGYAVKESPEFMPWTHKLAHDICNYFYGLFLEGNNNLRPDIKSQVTLDYREDGIYVDAIVVSLSHDSSYEVNDLRQFVISELQDHFKPYCEENGIHWDSPKFFINPTGRFVEHGPYGDSGITGRKLTVDTYGGRGYHGGGAFINKDPTKTDMSALVTARWIAKSVVASGLATECDVQLAYAIGVPYPVSVNINTKGTGTISDSEISALVKSKMDLSVESIIKNLNLRQMDYRRVNCEGVFYNQDNPWEKPIVLK